MPPQGNAFTRIGNTGHATTAPKFKCILNRSPYFTISVSGIVMGEQKQNVLQESLNKKIINKKIKRNTQLLYAALESFSRPFR